MNPASETVGPPTDHGRAASKLKFEQYLTLVMSRQSLSTFDEPKRRRRILVDNATGARYAISHDELTTATYSAHL